MERLVEILSRYRDHVFESPGYRFPRGMDHAECGIAILDRFGDQANRDQVIDLIYRNVLPFQFLINRIEPFDSALDMQQGYSRSLHQVIYSLTDVFEYIVKPLPAAFDEFLQFDVLFRLQVFECQVLELPPDAAHTQAVRDRGIDIKGFLRDPPSLLERQELERSHV